MNYQIQEAQVAYFLHLLYALGHLLLSRVVEADVHALEDAVLLVLSRAHDEGESELSTVPVVKHSEG